MVAQLGFGGPDSSDRLQQPSMIEPVDPFERVELDRLYIAPQSAPVDRFGLEKAVDGLGERIVLAVPAPPTDGSGPAYCEPFLSSSGERSFGVR